MPASCWSTLRVHRYACSLIVQQILGLGWALADLVGWVFFHSPTAVIDLAGWAILTPVDRRADYGLCADTSAAVRRPAGLRAARRFVDGARGGRRDLGPRRL